MPPRTTFRLPGGLTITEPQHAVLCLLAAWPQAWAHEEQVAVALRLPERAARTVLVSLAGKGLVVEDRTWIGEWRVTAEGCGAAWQVEQQRRRRAVVGGGKGTRQVGRAA